MNTFIRVGFVSILFSLIGCTSFRGSTDLHRGRVALLGGMPDAAIAHFTQLAALDDNVRYSQLQEGAWTYLGRAYYDAKRYEEARKALERAVVLNSDDSFARLYLGLTLARQGEHETAQKEILLGLKGLSDWLDYIAYNTTSGIYWDPAGQIRADVEASYRRVLAAKSNLNPLLAQLETLGTRIEREIDLASMDETRDRNRRAGGGD